MSGWFSRNSPKHHLKGWLPDFYRGTLPNYIDICSFMEVCFCIIFDIDFAIELNFLVMNFRTENQLNV